MSQTYFHRKSWWACPTAARKARCLFRTWDSCSYSGIMENDRQSEHKYKQCKKNETQKLFSIPLPSAGCEMVWRFLEVLFHVPHSRCRSKEPFPATYKPSIVGKINHVLGLLFSKENKRPNPVHTVTTQELGWSMCWGRRWGSGLHSCLWAGSRQSHTGHNSVSFVLVFLSFFLFSF